MADGISQEAFAALVARYPALVAAKDGLAALDAFRYDEAPQLYAAQGRLEPSQLQRLVEWKLRHGKFRPSLMKLVSSNAPETVWSATSAAAAASKSSSGASARRNTDTLGILTQLRGVGPATASLLLSVLDPQGAIFFSDEAYWWLCCGGRRDAIRYTPREYDALCARARALGDRLRGAAMVDVEKAAYVAMREGLGGEEAAGGEGGEKAKAKAKGGRTEGGDDKATKKRRAREELGSQQGQQGKTSLEKADAEGKAASDAADAGGKVKQQLDDGGLRRSKRTRAR